MFYHRLILGFFILLGVIEAQAQMQNEKSFLIDSLQKQLRIDSSRIFAPKIAKPFLKFENRYSFISNENVNLLGLMSGATFIDKHTFFVGFFSLDPLDRRPIKFKGNSTNRDHYLKMQHVVIGYQYVFLDKRYYQLNIPVSIGFGAYQVEVFDNNNNFLSARTGDVWPVNAGLQLILKPVSWLGFSTNGGYRFIGEKNNIELSLRGWYYSFGIWIDGRYVYRGLKYWHKKRIYKKELFKLL